MFIMNAEHLDDADRAINLAWCHKYMHPEASFSLATHLQQNQQRRIKQSAWD